MKVNGAPVTPPPQEILVLPRPTGDLVFVAEAVEDMDLFSELCPPPKPPGVRTKHGFEPNEKDENYRAALARYDEQRMAFMVLYSLKPTEIEWETVDIDKPSTWAKWSKEMRDAGLAPAELNQIISLVLNANCLNEDKLRKAREDFLAGRAVEASDSTSPHSEPQSSASGQPASD